MKKLILIRHGESQWNKLNLFTGWTNVDLSEKGIQEAIEAESKLEHKRRKSETKALNNWQKLYEEEKANRLNDVADLINENTRLLCENKRMRELLAKVKVKGL